MTNRALLCAVWCAVAPACVSKTIYLQKVDEAIRWKSNHEECSAELKRNFESRQKLEKMVLDERRSVAVCEFERKSGITSKRKDEALLREEIKATELKYKSIADDLNELRAKHSAAQEDVRALRKRVGDLRAEARRQPDLSDVTALLKGEVDQSEGALTLLRPKGAVVLRIAHRALFKKRNAAMMAEGKLLLSRIADALKRLVGKQFTVLGHQSDERVPKSLGSPLELSHFQAVVVTRELVRNGLDPQKLTTAGYGSLRPVVPVGAGTSADEENKRVELVITPTPAAESLEVITPEGGGAPAPQPPPPTKP